MKVGIAAKLEKLGAYGRTHTARCCAHLQVELRTRDDQLVQLRGWLDEAQEELLNTQVRPTVQLMGPKVLAATTGALTLRSCCVVPSVGDLLLCRAPLRSVRRSAAACRRSWRRCRPWQA